MNKLIIFDWTGVIKDALTAHLWVVNRIFKNHGLSEISADEFHDNWIEPYMKFFNKYLPEMTVEEEQKEYREAAMDPEYPKSKCVEGIKEMLVKLADKKYKMMVVSSDLPETVNKELVEFGINNIFVKVISGVSDKSGAIKETVSLYSGDRNHVYIVGDSVHEIQVGKPLGIKTIAVTWGFGSKGSLESMLPDKIFEDVADLQNYLLMEK